MIPILLFLCLLECSYCLEMIQVSRNARTKLPTTVSIDKYFYLINNDYYSTSYIYICFEDNNFGLSDISIKFCLTKTNPSSSPDVAVSGCSFISIYYYYKQSSSGTIKYYYKIPLSYYYYSIIYYQGSYSYGNLYVTTNYNDLVPTIKMTQVSRNSRASLPTTSSEDKYFYLTNNDYYSYSYIYICFEDKNFGLNNNKIKYCRTNTKPSSYLNAINDCSFNTIPYYSTQSSSGTIKYYYKISTSSSYYYSIVYYEGSSSYGYLYVICDYNDLDKTVKITQVSRNSRISLQTSSSFNKYFYLKNSDYYSNSSYIYICFEDSNFNLSYNNIRYCLINTNPSSYQDNAINNCSFSKISYYSTQSFSSVTKYYYNISITSSYTYSIFYYEGNNSYGYLYVTSDYNNFVQPVKMTQVSRISRTSLSTISSYSKYFFLTNSNYFNHSNYIYICLEDEHFNLSYKNIKYCLTNTNPSSNPDNAINNCSFSSISYYSSQNSSGIIKYYYKISITSSYTYSIVYYEGNNSYGYLYVTSDYIDLTRIVKITKVSSNSRISLPTTSSVDKYFYLTNSNYYSSSYIYICLEDNNFSLNYNNIYYCLTNTNPSSYNYNPISSSCYFFSLSYYSCQKSSGTIKYYFKISVISSYTYSIVYYDGSYSSGNLYVTSGNIDLAPTVKMTQVYRNSRTSLPISSSNDKYFYLININYFQYSNYIYFCLEDNNFGLSYNDIKYCLTNTNPHTYPDTAIKSCSFKSISNYSIQGSSSSTKYYYRISVNSSYNYSIVNYQGNYSSGNLYVTTDYKSISNDDNKELSTVAIIGIVAGSVVILVASIIIIYCCCPFSGKNKKDFIPVTQPSYDSQDSYEYSLNQADALLPDDNPKIPLQGFTVQNEAN